MTIAAQGLAVRGSFVVPANPGVDIFQGNFWTLEFPGISPDEIQLRGVLIGFTETTLEGIVTRPQVISEECWSPITEIRTATFAAENALFIGVYLTENASFPAIAPQWILHFTS